MFPGITVYFIGRGLAGWGPVSGPDTFCWSIAFVNAFHVRFRCAFRGRVKMDLKEGWDNRLDIFRISVRYSRSKLDGRWRECNIFLPFLSSCWLISSNYWFSRSCRFDRTSYTLKLGIFRKVFQVWERDRSKKRTEGRMYFNNSSNLATVLRRSIIPDYDDCFDISRIRRTITNRNIYILLSWEDI